MQTWAQILALGQKKLQDAGIAEYNLDAWYLFEHAFKISRMQYFMCSVQSAEPTEEALKEFHEGIERRAKREPLQHILGAGVLCEPSYFDPATGYRDIGGAGAGRSQREGSQTS